MITETVCIPKYKVSYLEQAIDKLNKKAVKLGCEPMTLTFHDEYEEKWMEHPITGMMLVTPYIIPMIHATLEYEIPKINGYEFIAKLDIYVSEAENVVIVSAAPDKEVPEEYKNLTSIHCDHCGMNRRRYHSVLLKHEDGSYKQVGSTCVKDFFGHDPKGFLLFAGIKFHKMVDDFDDMEYWGNNSRNLYSYDMKAVLAHTSACIKAFGWVSKSQAFEDPTLTPTADDVDLNLNPPNPMPGNLVLAEVTDEDKEIAEKTIEHFKNMEINNNNDYLLNCSKLVKLSYVPVKHMGLACSMVMVYRKHVESMKEKENELPSNWVGEVGERLKNIAVTCTFKREMPNDYGYGYNSPSVTVLYSFKDASGNVYKTFYSGYKWNCEVGDEVSLTGTVKKHGEYKGRKDTMLNRCVVAQ